MVKVRKRISLKTILLGAIACVALFASLFAVVKVGKQDKTKTLGLTNYTIATLNSSGLKTESNQHIVCKDFLNVDDMEIELKDDATISYKLYFFDEDKDLLSSNGVTSSLTADYDTSDIPSTAEYFKIVITPAQVDGEDVTVNILNMNRYVNQISVRYGK